MGIPPENVDAATELSQRIVALEARMHHERLTQPIRRALSTCEISWQRTGEGWIFMVIENGREPYPLHSAKIIIKAEAALVLPDMYAKLNKVVREELATKIAAAIEALKPLDTTA